MENEEKKTVFLNEEQLKSLDEVPEPFRALLKAKMEAVRSGRETPESSKITIQKDFQFDPKAGAGPLLAEFVKLVLKVSQQNAAAEPGPVPREEVAAVHKQIPEQQLNESFRSGAVTPASSGWVVWLALIGLAVFYFLYNRPG